MDQPTPQSNSALLERLAVIEQNLLPEETDLLLANVQRLAGIGTLTAGVAQELANLLSIVTTASISLRYELQLQNSSPDDTIQHYMSLIERNAFRSAQIVSMLQEYGALETQHMAITDIDLILQDTLMLVERQFRAESNIRIEVNAPGETQSIVCDHNRIVQLLVNVLLNARDSMQETGGLIEVKVQTIHRNNTDDLRRLAGLQKTGFDRVAVTISDEGPGIPADVQDQLCRPFFSARPDGNGVGLGLSIAHEIVQQHNGDICFSKSRGPAKGASVTIILPVRPSA